MKKTLLYFVILAILGVAVWFYLFSDKGNPFGMNEAGFTVKDTANIGKIFIANNTGTSVLLERTDSGWLANKYKVLPAPLHLLLTTLYNQQPLYPVAEPAQEHVIKALAGNAVKVEVYDRKGGKMIVFYVGDEAYKFAGTNMLMQGAKKAFVVKIDDYSGYLRPRYSPDIKDWRDRSIINLQPDEVRSVTVQYPDKPINSFTITNNNDKVTVTTDSAVMRSNAFNARRAGLYLKFFSNINGEGYLNGFADMDSILKIMPRKCTIDVTSNANTTTHIDIYWMPVNHRSKNLLTSDRYTPDKYDPDRFYAVFNHYKDTMLIQNFVFEKLMRQGYEFYQPDSAGANKVQKHALTRPSDPAVLLKK